MKASKIDDIEKLLLKNNGITNVVRYSLGAKSFERLINFTVRGVEYKIEWYKNVSTLWVGNVSVRFHKVEFSGTWPNSFKSNLQFYLNNEIVSVLGVEEYSK